MKHAGNIDRGCTTPAMPLGKKLVNKIIRNDSIAECGCFSSSSSSSAVVVVVPHTQKAVKLNSSLVEYIKEKYEMQWKHLSACHFDMLFSK